MPETIRRGWLSESQWLVRIGTTNLLIPLLNSQGNDLYRSETVIISEVNMS